MALLSTWIDGVDFDSAEGATAPRLVVDVNQGSSNSSSTELPNGETYNDSLYLLTDSAMSWAAAQAHAESLGGNLVTINDAAENQWLKNTFGATEALWTGFSDAETEGVWKWASGEGSDWILGASNDGIYADWAPNQPDDYNGNQDYAILSHMWDSSTDQWDDVTSTNQHRGIIEIKVTPEPGVVEVLEAGNDYLVGGSGHDSLTGGAGDDILNGTDGVAVGLNELDILIGGGGSDQFILGEAGSAYYHQGGSSDFVTIQDFDLGVDTVQLYGSSTDYSQTTQGDDTLLYWQGQDLVGQFNGMTSLDLANASFQFVV